MTLVNATTARNGLSDAFDALVNAGANPGGLRLWTGTDADGTQLVEFEFSATAFGASSSGVITLADVPITGTATATGTAQSADIVQDLTGTPVQLVHGDIGAEFTINNASITSSQDVDLTALTYTTPAS
jgi:hypothetical protein